jgi:hypothetical protein
MPRSRRNHTKTASPVSTPSISTIPVPPKQKHFYTLQESIAFENDPNVRIVYMTEKGIDFNEIFPEDVQLDYALRHGYSWYNLMMNPQSFTNNTNMNKRICIVDTSLTELAAYNTQKKVKENAMHTKAILESVRALTTYSVEDLVDIVTTYLYTNNITDNSYWNEICDILDTEHLIPIEAVVAVAPMEPVVDTKVTKVVEVEAVVDKEMEILEDADVRYMKKEPPPPPSRIESMFTWISDILSVPDVSWVLLD